MEQQCCPSAAGIMSIRIDQLIIPVWKYWHTQIRWAKLRPPFLLFFFLFHDQPSHKGIWKHPRSQPCFCQMSCFDHIGRRTIIIPTLLVIKYINEGVNGRGGVHRSQIISFPLIRFKLNLHPSRWHQAVLAVETLAWGDLRGMRTFPPPTDSCCRPPERAALDLGRGKLLPRWRENDL